MGLSNIQRELIIKQQMINNCDIIITPVSEQSEFNTISDMYTTILSEIINKNIHLKTKKSKKIEEIKLDKIELDESENQELIESVQKKNEDLLQDPEELSDDDLDLLEETTEVSPDVESNDIDSESVDLEEPYDENLEDDIIKDKVDTTEVKIDKHDKKEVEMETAKMPDIDQLFFTTLSDINSKKSKENTHKSKDESIKDKVESITDKKEESNVEDKSGGANIKKIKLTEKYDFF